MTLGDKLTIISIFVGVLMPIVVWLIAMRIDVSVLKQAVRKQEEEIKEIKKTHDAVMQKFIDDLRGRRN